MFSEQKKFVLPIPAWISIPPRNTRIKVWKKVIGRGSFGQIHRATNSKTRKNYAIKIERRDNHICLLKIEYYTYKQL